MFAATRRCVPCLPGLLQTPCAGQGSGLTRPDPDTGQSWGLTMYYQRGQGPIKVLDCTMNKGKSRLKSWALCDGLSEGAMG